MKKFSLKNGSEGIAFRSGYILAIVAVLAAFAIRTLLLADFGAQFAFVTFYPAIMLSALYGGGRPGALATLLAAMIVDFFYTDPVGQFRVDNPTDRMALVVFVGSGLLPSWMIGTHFFALQQAKKQLADSSKLNESVISNAPVGIYLYRADGQCVMANAAACTLIGGSKEQLLAQNFWSLVSWRESGLLDFATAVLDDRKPRTQEFHIRTTFGADFWVSLRAAAVEIADMPHLLLAAIDLSQRKQTEIELNKALEISELLSRNLAESERFVRLVTDNVPGLIGYWDANEHCRFANATYQDWFGRSPEELKDISLRDLMGDEIYCKTEAYVRRVLTGETLAFERAMTKVDGSVGHMLLQYAPDIGPDQEVRGFVVNALDITTINRTQLQLVRANTELEQFATFVSHDLRQPLSAVRGFLSLMKKIYGPQLPAEAGTLLQNAIASTSTMEEFIADVLEYSRLSNDSEPVLVSLADAVSEALTNLHQKIVDADVDLSVADKLPTIMGDPGALVRLFENLVGNAIKYRSHNRMLILEIGWRRQGDDEVVWVKDNGVGIAPVNHDIAFAMFKRLVPQDAVEGSGVGLAICKKVMERHGGKIWIESEIDQGTTMFMSFPVVPVAAAVAH